MHPYVGTTVWLLLHSILCLNVSPNTQLRLVLANFCN